MSHNLTPHFSFLRRDDEELFAGDFISKIIVPHPALNFPKNITITYQVYRGWLTRGLSSWSINKVILSDSFGESYSLCKQYKMESGKPQRMTLQSGDCNEEELKQKAEKAKKEAKKRIESTTTIAPSTSSESNLSMNTSEPLVLGKHILLESSSSKLDTETLAVESTTEIAETFDASWKPILNTTTMKQNITSPALTNSSEIEDEKFLNLGERMPKKAKTEKRSFGEIEDRLNSVPIREDSSAFEDVIDDETTTEESSVDNKFVTVQLFPYKLGKKFYATCD